MRVCQPTRISHRLSMPVLNPSTSPASTRLPASWMTMPMQGRTGRYPPKTVRLGCDAFGLVSGLALDQPADLQPEPNRRPMRVMPCHACQPAGILTSRCPVAGRVPPRRCVVVFPTRHPHGRRELGPIVGRGLLVEGSCDAQIRHSASSGSLRLRDVRAGLPAQGQGIHRHRFG